MNIAGYLKTSLIEWPGKVSSVIFTQGCNFRCPFCHNADLVGIRRFTPIPEEQIFADLEQRRKWVDAVVISGGEPTLQEDLLGFLGRLGGLGLLRMIHTNGTRPEIINKLLINRLTDYICMDLKGNFDEYQKFTNVKSQMLNVKNSMEMIIKSGIEYEFRTTVVPGLHNIKNLIALAKQLKTTVYRLQSTVDSSLKTVDSIRWFLQQFRPINTFDKKYLKVKPFSKEEMEDFQKELQKIIPQTSLRGAE